MSFQKIQIQLKSDMEVCDWFTLLFNESPNISEIRTCEKIYNI